MYEAKIEFSVGAISFAAEGDKDWVATQLDKILEKAPGLVQLAREKPPEEAPPDVQPPDGQRGDDDIAQLTLSSFLQQTGSMTTQVRKFLATAVWLTAKGKERLTTGDVTGALRQSSQRRLSNASDCLNKNVAKGFCEKTGREFFVTQQGKESL